VPMENQSKNGSGGDAGTGEVERQRDNGEEEARVEVERQGEWDLRQVLNPGVPMSEEEDPSLVGLQVNRLPAITHHLEPRRVGRRAPRNLETGFTFTLATSDPLNYPLPHPDLLSLHATVMRVARAAGATEFEEEEFDSLAEEIVQLRNRMQEEQISFTMMRFLQGRV